MIRIAIVDDRANNRNILSDKLQRNAFFTVSMQAANGQDFLDQMKNTADAERPHVVLMDLEMPNMDGVDAIAAGSSFFPSVKFVVLTIFDDDDKIFEAIKAGAHGYLLKDENGKPLATPLYDWGLTASFHDLNGDGAPDLYVCNDFETPDRFWLNMGGGRFQAAPGLTLRKSSLFSMGVDVADINRDGWDDIFVLDMLNREHRLRITQMLPLPPLPEEVSRIEGRPNT